MDSLTLASLLLCMKTGMASAAVKERLNRLGQGVLQPSAGLAALATVLRSAPGLMSLGAPAAAVLAGAAGPAVVTVNPFKWGTYLEHMQVRLCWCLL
jgi:hypothetical protein